MASQHLSRDIKFVGNGIQKKKLRQFEVLARLVLILRCVVVEYAGRHYVYARRTHMRGRD